MTLYRRNLPALATFFSMTLIFAYFCHLSWHRWASPVIDGGREMNLPLRLLKGEMLYSQAYYLYGPFAPYLNALLYKAFCVHLDTLYFAGIACSMLLSLIVFQLGRQFMGTLEATLATLAVMALCVFKQGGHTIFPYTFSALYGTLLSLAAFTMQIRYMREQKPIYLTISGLLIGLTLICKLEYAFAAIASTTALILSAPSGEKRNIVSRTLLPALAIPILTYAFLLTKVSPSALFRDTFLLPQYVPRELVYFNKQRLGLHDPAKTMSELLQAVALVSSLAGMTALISIHLARLVQSERKTNLPVWTHWLYWITAVSLAVFFANRLQWRIDWFISPLRALPLLCGISIVGYLLRNHQAREQPDRRAAFLLSIYSFTVLIREITRVPSGGAYAAFILPVPLLFFTYSTTTLYPSFFAPFPTAERLARWIAVGLFVVVLVFTMKHIIRIYESEPYYDLQTARGNMRVPADVGPAFTETLRFITQSTHPQDYIFAAPEGSSLNFLSNRPAPLRYEVLTPGFLDSNGEQEAIQQLKDRQVKFVFILNRPTPEFGAAAFGRDYCRELMNWIQNHYDLFKVFGNQANANSKIGDKSFFIKCYRLKEGSETATNFVALDRARHATHRQRN